MRKSHDFSCQLAMRKNDFEAVISLLIPKRETPIGGILNIRGILKFTNRFCILVSPGPEGRVGGGTHCKRDKPCGKGLLPQQTAALYFIYDFSPT